MALLLGSFLLGRSADCDGHDGKENDDLYVGWNIFRKKPLVFEEEFTLVFMFFG